MATSNEKAVIPSITGNPMLDTILAGSITGAGGLITGIAVGWLNAHGFNDPNLGTYIGSAVTGTLVSIAVIIWRLMGDKKTEVAVADHVIEAAATGQIPDKILQTAVKAPTISEAKIQAAVVNAEEIKTKVNP